MSEVDPTRVKAVVMHGDLMAELDEEELKTLLLGHPEVVVARYPLSYQQPLTHQSLTNSLPPM